MEEFYFLVEYRSISKFSEESIIRSDCQMLIPVTGFAFNLIL